MSKIERNPSLNIIRCCALFMVIGIHFFMNSGFYEEIISGPQMYFLVLIRTFFMICVPLFLILSGYLLCGKSLDVRYYGRIIEIFLIYISASVACKIAQAIFGNGTINLGELVGGILDYTAAPYAWYIEMYVGLFFLIPFLNILYKNLPSIRWKLTFIIVMCCLTSLGDVLNVYNFESLFWWSAPRTAAEYQKIIPFWWGEMYPLTYYFLGCFLREYGLKLTKRFNFFLLLVSIVIFGTYNFWRSYGGVYVGGAWQSHKSIFCLVIAVLFFNLLLNINTDKISGATKSVLKEMSDSCLGGYLLSWILDSAIYPYLCTYVSGVEKRFIYMIPIVVCIFCGSIVLSWVLTKICQLLCCVVKGLSVKCEYQKRDDISGKEMHEFK